MLVEIRGKKDQLQVRLWNENWNLCFMELKDKLKNIIKLQIEEIHLFIQNPISKTELKDIVSLTRSMQICIASITYIHQNAILETLDVIGVGHHQFDHDVLILSDIRMHTSITMVHGNLYVFGCVSGDIEFYSKQSKLYALRIEKLRMKMNDMPMRYIEYEPSCILQYERKEQGKWQDQL